LRLLRQLLRAAGERDLRGVDLERRRAGGQEALVEDDRAPAVAGQTLGLRLGEQELAPRIEREPRLEVADGGRVVVRLEPLERAVVERLRRRVHRPFDLDGASLGRRRGGVGRVRAERGAAEAERQEGCQAAAPSAPEAPAWR